MEKPLAALRLRILALRISQYRSDVGNCRRRLRLLLLRGRTIIQRVLTEPAAATLLVTSSVHNGSGVISDHASVLGGL